MNEPDNTTSVPELQLVAFRLGMDSFGIDLSQVREIIRIPEITPVPFSPGYIKGVVNLRGKVIAVIDLRTRLGLPPQDMGTSSRIMVIEGSPDPVGMMVDVVDGVVQLTQDQLKPPSSLITPIDGRYIRGLGTLTDRWLILLDLPRVLKRQKQSKRESLDDIDQ